VVLNSCWESNTHKGFVSNERLAEEYYKDVQNLNVDLRIKDI